MLSDTNTKPSLFILFDSHIITIKQHIKSFADRFIMFNRNTALGFIAGVASTFLIIKLLKSK